ncbi:MAG: hypothetical protein HY986_20025 [Candidatus Melainabacteria bacterium]|nr:hypothetical protein [Candidatus Melainabacteria bacterium]
MILWSMPLSSQIRLKKQLEGRAQQLEIDLAEPKCFQRKRLELQQSIMFKLDEICSESHFQKCAKNWLK